MILLCYKSCFNMHVKDVSKSISMIHVEHENTNQAQMQL